MKLRERVTLGGAFVLLFIAATLVSPIVRAQLQNSGGSSVSITGTLPAYAAIPTFKTDQTTHGTTDLIASDQVKINGVAISTGNGVVGTGVQRVAIASDNTAFTVNAAQSGVYTVQPGNTANTTPWFIKQIPAHNCAGNTFDDVTSVDVATTTGTAVTAVDTCVFEIYANNKTGTAATLTIQDTSGTPIVYSTTFSIPPNSDVIRNFMGHKFLGGVKLIAGTGSAINAVTIGVH